MLDKENLQAIQHDFVFPNQEKEELSVFEITFVFCSLENKHFLCSYSWGDCGGAGGEEWGGCLCFCEQGRREEERKETEKEIF